MVADFGVGYTVLAIALTGFVAVLSPPPPTPPVDVYAPPPPSVNEEPHSLIPPTVADLDLMSQDDQTYSHANGSLGEYEDSVRIEITRWDNASLAASYLDQGRNHFSRLGAVTFAARGDTHWFAYDGDSESVFSWRRGVWVFDVRAPDKNLRDRVTEELAFGKSFNSPPSQDATSLAPELVLDSILTRTGRGVAS